MHPISIIQDTVCNHLRRIQIYSIIVSMYKSYATASKDRLGAAEEREGKTTYECE